MKNKNLNFEMQMYKGIPIKLIDRSYETMKARRFTINSTNQNVWIPMKHLLPDCSIMPGENIDYVFLRAKRQCEIAGINVYDKLK